MTEHQAKQNISQKENADPDLKLAKPVLVASPFS
jgi:hypothetical protein